MLLELSNIYFSYSGEKLISDVSFGIKNGEFVFLIGKSGCGKSTLLQMIYMNLKPQSGFIRFGRYISSSIKNRQIHYLRRNLGVVFQDFKLLKDRTISENLGFVLEVTNAGKRETKRKISSVLTEVGLSHRKNSYPNELSGGEQQRIAIARAIINEPALVIADEPTGNLDPETSLEILSLFKKINSKGTAVLFATHNYDLIKKHQARIIQLNNGSASEVRLKQKTEQS